MKTCTIIGLGTAGCVSALVLTKLGIKCTIYELRSSPATIGGAINLTPNALNLLSSLGVEVSGCRCDQIEIFSYHNGKLLGALTFRGARGHASRVVREGLLRGLVDAVERAGVRVVYGAKLVGVDEGEEYVVARFENGMRAERADVVLGCDGMYSAVRMQYVEGERKPIYTNIASAYSVVDGEGVRGKLHFQQTGLNSGRWGSLLTTFCDPEKKRIYLASIMETPEQESRDGWKARGEDNEEISREMVRRYGDAVFDCIPELIQKVDAWTFYPVYRLEPGGRWSRGRALLLGDAAHGMPPQGESTGLAIEDAVLFSRIVEKFPDKSVQDLFQIHEKTRRPRIDLAYKHATSRWRVYDKSWLVNQIEEWVTWLYLWWNSAAFQKSVNYDITKEEILE